MDLRLELVTLPVADVDRAKAFYVERLGFAVHVDHSAGDSFRIVQLDPPGSACSIAFGVGLTDAEPGSAKGLYLVVSDIEAAHAELVARGAPISDPFHFDETGQVPGLHPGRGEYETFCELQDPDGNAWLIQECPSRAES